MKKLLKYLLLVIVAAAFACSADSDVCVDAGCDFAEECIFDQTCLTSISSTESELCLPRQVSFANTLPVQGSPQRTNANQRNNIEFAKAGKVINAGIQYVVQKSIILTRSPQAEPSHMLLCLGILII